MIAKRVGLARGALKSLRQSFYEQGGITNQSRSRGGPGVAKVDLADYLAPRGKGKLLVAVQASQPTSSSTGLKKQPGWRTREELSFIRETIVPLRFVIPESERWTGPII